MRSAAMLLLSLAAAPQAPQPPAPVHAEFRIFAGTTEITGSTRLRVMPTGSREHPITVAEGGPLSVELEAGIYDVQALHLRRGSIAGIRWAERLVVMYYPDEGGRHLEVINFEPGYGALQLRAAKGQLDAYDVAIFPAGSRLAPAPASVSGEGYRLFVVPAGHYDVRVRPAGASEDSEDTHWFLDIEVPADRTRLKQIP